MGTKEEGRPLVQWARLGGWLALACLLLAGLPFTIGWLHYGDWQRTVPHSIEMLPADQQATVEDLPSSDYEWVDRDAGVVRIPLQEAMQIVGDNADGGR